MIRWKHSVTGVGVSTRRNDGSVLKRCSIIYSITGLPLSRIGGFHERTHDVSVSSFISIGPGWVGTSYGSLIVTDSLGRLYAPWPSSLTAATRKS